MGTRLVACCSHGCVRAGMKRLFSRFFLYLDIVVVVSLFEAANVCCVKTEMELILSLRSSKFTRFCMKL